MSYAGSISDNASTASRTKDPSKNVWMNSQWTTLSWQAKGLGMPQLPYFDPKTMLLSKEVNKNLWRQLSRLYNFLGAEKAPYVTPVLLQNGELEWRSFLDGSKGDKAEIYDEE